MVSAAMGLTILVLGGSGGLGSAICREFARRGGPPARIVTASRSAPAWLPELPGGLHVQLDVEDDASLLSFAGRVAQALGAPHPVAGQEPLQPTAPSPLLDVVVDAIGHDVRKPLLSHTLADVDRSLRINQRAPILLLQQLVPLVRPGGTFAYLGGFADGGLAFPYYSVDVSTRAAVFSFMESCRREFALDGTDVRLLYFCPSAADTEAERGYKDLWKEMGAEFVSPDKVASELAEAVERRREVKMMGTGTGTMASINRLSPCTADFFYLGNAGKVLQKWFGRGNTR
ncbi:hypothetical protein DFJ74DRAFT_672585 [Hyaloraphidium curvatum]|nr:hypothetical protein DFJ74DRAFT_672585 [Hyaloraphidium curvatum]